MKYFKMILAAVLVIATLGTAWAQQSTTAIGSGAFTSSGVLIARPARLVDVSVQTTGAADVTVLIYDSASTATGRIIAFVYVPQNAKVGAWNCPVPSMAVNGMYASVTGTGVTRILVSYDPQ